MPYNNVTPEVLAAMLGLSEQDEEKKLLQKQLALGNMLGESAIGYRGQAAGAGGFANALAQGLQGYVAGKQMQKYDTGTLAGMDKRRDQRKKFYDMIIGGQPPDMGEIPAALTSSAAAPSNVPNPAQMPMLPQVGRPGTGAPQNVIGTPLEGVTVGRPGVGLPAFNNPYKPYKPPLWTEELEVR